MFSLGLPMSLHSSGNGLEGSPPSLSLPFAFKKSLDATIGPSPSFSRASGATFVDEDGLIKYVSLHVPRFDHDPVTLECKGLLVEGQRVNLARYSNDIENSTWLKQAVTVGSDTLAPNGELTAKAVHFSGDVGDTGLFMPIPNSFSAGDKVAVSFYVKAATPSQIYLGIEGATMAGNNSYSLKNVGMGWSRVSETFTVDVNDTGLFLAIRTRMSSPTSPAPLPECDIEVWGAQLEVGSSASSYIPTATAAVTRSADVCSISGADFASFWDQSEGTVIIECDTTTPGNNVVLWAATDGTAANYFFNLPGSLSFYAEADDVGQFSLSTGGDYPANALVRSASAYAANDFAASRDGSAPVVDTSGNPPVVNQFHLGSRDGFNPNSGHISSLRYYPKRLPNETLIRLTT